MINIVGRDIPEQIDGYGVVKPYQGLFATTPSGRTVGRKLEVDKPKSDKVLRSIEAAIDAVGLRDGMTISFHHHFRNGDRVLNTVLEAIAKKGIRDLTLAPSSLHDGNDFIIPLLESGVITAVQTSGTRGKLGRYLTFNQLSKPTIIRSHGGRARAIESGELHIDVAFIGAPISDRNGNINGVDGKSACGAMGYAMVDAAYADQVVVITDNLVSEPVYPVSISQSQVDYIVEIDSIGDPAGIETAALRHSKDPRELLIAERAAEVIEHSGYFKDGYSLQLGGGGASIAVGNFIREKMISQKIAGSFGLGGITGPFVDLLEEGLFKAAYDTQSFDARAIESLKKNPNHVEISASQYANPHSRGPFVNKLDVVVLGATEIDIDFNVNGITNSFGVMMGATGGQPDTAAGANLTVIVAPLVRGRFPIILDKVHTIVTPGDSVDVIVTDRGIAVNPRNTEVLANLKAAGLPLKSIEELQAMAYRYTGKPEETRVSSQIAGIVEYRDGSVIDLIYRPE